MEAWLSGEVTPGVYAYDEREEAERRADEVAGGVRDAGSDLRPNVQGEGQRATRPRTAVRREESHHVVEPHFPEHAPEQGRTLPLPHGDRGRSGPAGPGPARLLGRPTDALVASVFRWLVTHLGGWFTEGCGGPVRAGSWDGGLHCQAFQEPSCRHVLVHFKGAGVPLGPEAVDLSRRWVAQSGINSEVIVVLPAGEGARDVPRSLRHYNWLRHPAPASEIGLPILQAAGVGARRSVFVSYRRQDSQTLADQIFEGLGREGFRVYLDRFSWTPGRLFPEEIAEELADMGVVVLLESSRLHLSRWTQWELAFARTYHLGTLALHLEGAPRQRGIHPQDRHDVTVGSDGKLTAADLERAIRFIRRRYGLAELRRRVFLEAVVRRAASSGGGRTEIRGDGLFEVSGGGHRALVLPSGRPGNLEDLGRVGRASPEPAHRLLAGQHEHLRTGARRELEWLANRARVSLCSPLGLYRSIRNVLEGRTP